jgi:hypothetical protein
LAPPPALLSKKAAEYTIEGTRMPDAPPTPGSGEPADRTAARAAGSREHGECKCECEPSRGGRQL